jgi:hypothetical protein
MAPANEIPNRIVTGTTRRIPLRRNAVDTPPPGLRSFSIAQANSANVANQNYSEVIAVTHTRQQDTRQNYIPNHRNQDNQNNEQETNNSSDRLYHTLNILINKVQSLELQVRNISENQNTNESQRGLTLL